MYQPAVAPRSSSSKERPFPESPRLNQNKYTKSGDYTMRKNFIAGNWKMHKTTGEAVALAKDLVSALAGGPNKYMIAPSFTALDAVSKVVSGTNILLGAQNMSTDEQGAHTGEVSVLQ